MPWRTNGLWVGEYVWETSDEPERPVSFQMDLRETFLTGIIKGSIADHIPEPGRISGSRMFRTVSLYKAHEHFWVAPESGGRRPVRLDRYIREDFDDEPVETYSHPEVQFQGRLSLDGSEIRGRVFLQPTMVPLLRSGQWVPFEARVGTWWATRVATPPPVPSVAPR